jgi:hypothetical protein
MMQKQVWTLFLALLLFTAAVAASGADYRANRKLRGMPVEAVEVSKMLYTYYMVLQ